MIIKIKCQQCKEEFDHDILCHTRTPNKKYCDHCLNERDKMRKEIKRKKAKQG